MKKLRQGPVLYLGVKGVDDDDDDVRTEVTSGGSALQGKVNRIRGIDWINLAKCRVQ